MSWMQMAPAVLAAFMASLVEFVEALTIVLAVGTTRGWRPAVMGTGLGILTLAILIGVFGPALTAVPLAPLQLVIGVLLLLFGFRWLRKAILRSAGVIALHDEDMIFARERARMLAEGEGPPSWLADPVAVVTAYKAVVLEGLEVVFIVLATGAGSRSLGPSILGAVLAGVLVVIIGLLLHRPLTRVPENTLKFAVGLVLSAFGIFWIGEALHYPWPGQDLFIFALAGWLFIVAQAGVRIARRVSA